MNTLDYFKRLFTYNDWANQRYLDTFASMEEIPERLKLLLTHTLVAQQLWLSRLKGDSSQGLDIWEVQSLEQMRAVSAESSKELMDYLKACEPNDIDCLCNYNNTKGVPFKTPVGDIIIHVANHGTYHRPQLATLLRQMDIDPPVTDYIAFSRELMG